MSKEDKKVPVDNQEDFILKKIRYYQGTIDDYETFWNKKAAEGEKEECPETKNLKKHNDELNKSYTIVPVEKDETVIGKDIVSGKDAEKASDNTDVKPDAEEGNKDAKKDAGLEADKEGNKEGDGEKKKKKKVKDDDDHDHDDDHDDDDDDDDDDDKKKSKKKDKDDD